MGEIDQLKLEAGQIQDELHQLIKDGKSGTGYADQLRCKFAPLYVKIYMAEKETEPPQPKQTITMHWESANPETKINNDSCNKIN